MRDRQYRSSLAISVAVVAAALGGIVFLAFWAGWGLGVGFLAILSGSLGWFYWGPRPDLRPRGRGEEQDWPGNE